MEYTLTLPKHAITYGNGRWQGTSNHDDAQWAPWAPTEHNGLQDGDTVAISAHFNLDPNLSEKPPARDYFGLAAIALYKPTEDEEKQAIRQLNGGNRDGWVGRGITDKTSPPTPGSRVYFYKATSSVVPPVELTPPTRGTVKGLVYKWVLTYYADPTLPDAGSNIVFAFGYGDPQISIDHE